MYLKMVQSLFLGATISGLNSNQFPTQTASFTIDDTEISRRGIFSTRCVVKKSSFL